MSPIEQRKLDHVKIVANDSTMDRQKSHFDAIRLRPCAFPEMNASDVNPATTFLGSSLQFPFLISSMTGGPGAEIAQINRNLAEAAEAEGVAMGVGSQRVMWNDASALASFSLREVAPTAPLYANIGAVQLNYGLSLDQVRQSMDVLQANALILHVNALQEAIQPEGDTDFSNLLKQIGALCEAVDFPVIVKEVGAGIGRADAGRLIEAGVSAIDVAGTGGTSWSRIESARCEDPSLGELFQDWGIPTPCALRSLTGVKVPVVASGGVRTGIDMAKAIVLGASLCGMARPLLAPAMESADAVRLVIQRVRKEFETAMFLLGTRTIDELKASEELKHS